LADGALKLVSLECALCGRIAEGVFGNDRAAELLSCCRQLVMSASAYAEGGDGSSGLGVGNLEFLNWQGGQVAVTRRPACVVLAIICMIPVPAYYAVGRSSTSALERLVGYGSFAPSSSLGLCITQAALFLLIAYISKPGRSSGSLKLRRPNVYATNFLLILTLLSTALLCPSCLLALTAAPASHGVSHSAILFAIACFLIDPSLFSALPAAAATLVSNACYIAFAPRDTAVYHSFM
jgi:hypothetical protein